MSPTSFPPTVSVVIPVLNGATTIGEQLDALEGQSATAPWELIIADNGSTDDTVPIVKAHPIAHRIPVAIIDASSVRGTNHARNRGVHAARADIIALCDADDRVDSGWVQAYIDAFTDRSVELGAGPTITHDINDQRFRLHAGLTAPFAVGGYLAGIGANFAIRRHVWEQLGGFDESFSGGFDEFDFMIRAQKSGVHLTWLTDALVHYRFSTSMRAAWWRHVGRGAMRVHMSRHHPDVLSRPRVIRVATRVPLRAFALLRAACRRRHVVALAPLAYDIGMLRALWRSRHE